VSAYLWGLVYKNHYIFFFQLAIPVSFLILSTYIFCNDGSVLKIMISAAKKLVNVFTPPPLEQCIATAESYNVDYYRYWRLRIMYSAIFGYAAFYLVRLNLSMAMPVMANQFNYTKAEMGAVVTIWSIVYGIGKFVNGYFSDRSDARTFMTVGLFGTAIANIFMGMGSHLYYFVAFWAVSAWFQSMAWPPVARMLTHWFSPKELGTKWGIWSTSHQIGGLTIFLLAAYLIEHYGWRSAFYLPAFFAIGIAFLLYNRIRDTPESIGFPPPEIYKGDVQKPVLVELEAHLTHKELLKRVLLNRLLWFVCLGNMCLYIVRIGIFTWAPTFLQEMKGSTLMASGWQSAAFEVAGLLGGVAAGWISDRYFSGRRGPVSSVYMTGLIFALLYFWKGPSGHAWMDAFAMLPIGFMVYGPQVLAGVAAADFSSKKAVGLATGLIGVFGYLGGAISGIGTGIIADTWGWDGGFIFFTICAMLGVVAFAVTWNHRAKVLD
jgi:phosphoglycerate transporter family protein